MFPVIPRVNNNYLFNMFPRLAIIYAFYYFHNKQRYLYFFRFTEQTAFIETKIFEWDKNKFLNYFLINFML